MLVTQAELGKGPADHASSSPRQVRDPAFVARLCNNLELLEDVSVGLEFGFSRDGYFITAYHCYPFGRRPVISGTIMESLPVAKSAYLARKGWLCTSSPMTLSFFGGNGIVGAQELQGPMPVRSMVKTRVRFSRCSNWYTFLRFIVAFFAHEYMRD
jgi:hypothetical protein